jgi:hypothetical protein
MIDDLELLEDLTEDSPTARPGAACKCGATSFEGTLYLFIHADASTEWVCRAHYLELIAQGVPQRDMIAYLGEIAT